MVYLMVLCNFKNFNIQSTFSKIDWKRTLCSCGLVKKVLMSEAFKRLKRDPLLTIRKYTMITIGN